MLLISLIVNYSLVNYHSYIELKAIWLFTSLRDNDTTKSQKTIMYNVRFVKLYLQFAFL